MGQPICQGRGGAAFNSFVCLCNLNFHYPFPSGLCLTTLLLYIFRKKVFAVSVLTFFFSLDEYKILQSGGENAVL